MTRVLQAPTRRTVAPTEPKPVWDYIFAGLFAVLVFAPYLVAKVTPTRLAAILILTVVIVYESSIRSRQAATWAVVFVMPYALVIIALFGELRIAGADSYEVERLFFIAPAGLRAGYLVMQNDRVRVWARVLVYAGLINAVLAVYEEHAGHSLFGRSVTYALMERDGGTRALLASDHSLVLGAVLAACVPLIAVAGFQKRRLLLALILLWGTWATGSRGPTILAVAVTIMFLVPHSDEWLRRSYRIWRRLTVLGLVVIGLLGIFVWTPVAAGSSGSDYSTAYRTALYSILPRILVSHPFGYGLHGLPTNRWLIDSGIFGVKDVAVTIDSELVIWASIFGIIGVAIFIGALLVAVTSIGRDAYLGMATSTVTLTGLFLALSSWDSLGPFWYLLLGCSIYLCRRGSHAATKTADLF